MENLQEANEKLDKRIKERNLLKNKPTKDAKVHQNKDTDTDTDLSDSDIDSDYSEIEDTKTIKDTGSTKSCPGIRANKGEGAKKKKQSRHPHH
jgi:hypothetical protein